MAEAPAPPVQVEPTPPPRPLTYADRVSQAFSALKNAQNQEEWREAHKRFIQEFPPDRGIEKDFRLEKIPIAQWRQIPVTRRRQAQPTPGTPVEPPVEPPVPVVPVPTPPEEQGEPTAPETEDVSIATHRDESGNLVVEKVRVRKGPRAKPVVQIPKDTEPPSGPKITQPDATPQPSQTEPVEIASTLTQSSSPAAPATPSQVTEVSPTVAPMISPPEPPVPQTGPQPSVYEVARQQRLEELRERARERAAAYEPLESTTTTVVPPVVSQPKPEEAETTIILPEIEPSVEEFVKAIVKKNAYGKLPSGSQIDGKDIHFRGTDFRDHGPDSNIERPQSEMDVLGLTDKIYKNQIPDLLSSHVVSVVPSENNPGNMLLFIHFFQDKNQIDSRTYNTSGNVGVEMPADVMSDFLKKVVENPDFLEDFYQSAFVGLDSQDGKPGMLRIKSDGFFLITGDKLKEAGKISKQIGTSGTTTFFNSLEKHQYSHGPYGTGAALTLESK